jgi:hypothetical protein
VRGLKCKRQDAEGAEETAEKTWSRFLGGCLGVSALAFLHQS